MAMLRLLVPVGVIAGLVLGPCGLILAWQLDTVSAAAQPTPQTLSVAELAEKGAGDNLHVELTDLAFGKPVVDVKEGRWLYVWVPIEPAGKGSGKPVRAVFLRTTTPKDQEQLDGLLQQTTLRALVTTPLPANSVWKAQPTEALRKAYPKLDAADPVFLVDPRLEAGDTVLLAADQLFDRTNASIAWGVALGLVGVGLVCLVLMFVGEKKEPKADLGPVPVVSEQERERLAVAIPQSVHHFTFWRWLYRSVGWLIVAGLLGLLGLAGLAGIADCVGQGKMDSALIGGFLTLLVFLGALGCVGRCLRVYAARVSEMAVCHTGLRWTHRGRHRTAIWAELAGVKVQEFVSSYRGRVKDWYAYLTLTLRTGEKLEIMSEAISDFPRLHKLLAENVEQHNQVVRGADDGGLARAFAGRPRAGRR